LSAFGHVKAAFRIGHCRTDRAIRPAPLQDVSRPLCPLCLREFTSLSNYNFHLRTHLSPGALVLQDEDLIDLSSLAQTAIVEF
jgi:hypothetical protein